MEKGEAEHDMDKQLKKMVLAATCVELLPLNMYLCTVLEANLRWLAAVP